MPYADIKSIEAEWKPGMHKALSFDGVGDYVEVNNTISLQQLTITAWIKTDIAQSQTTWGQMIASTGWKGFDFFLNNYANTQVLKFIYWNGTQYVHVIETTVKIKPNRWYFVAATLENELRLYINGNLEASAQRAGNITYGSYTLKIGARGDGSGIYFDGIIDEVRIYNRALSDSEIKYLYHNPFDPIDEDSLVLWLNPTGIDAAAGKWWDLSGKGNHGTIYGATEVQLTSPEVEVM